MHRFICSENREKISFRPKMAMNCQLFAERMHKRFVGSLTTAGVGDGPTETCLQLYWSNIWGVAGPPAQKKNQFPKMAKNCQFFAERMHERFVGSLTTAGVGDGPTETC